MNKKKYTIPQIILTPGSPAIGRSACSRPASPTQEDEEDMASATLPRSATCPGSDREKEDHQQSSQVLNNISHSSSVKLLTVDRNNTHTCMIYVLCLFVVENTLINAWSVEIFIKTLITACLFLLGVCFVDMLLFYRSPLPRKRSSSSLWSVTPSVAGWMSSDVPFNAPTGHHKLPTTRTQIAQVSIAM